MELFNDIYSNVDRVENAGKPRAHLGASEIGGTDTRSTWFKYRWCLTREFERRVLRLYRLGNILEDEIISILRKIPNVIVYNEAEGEQFGFSELGGHFSGSLDGVISGLPESPKTPHLLECKSASKKQFDALKKLGDYSKWKSTYAAQIQIYMGAMALKRALVAVYCKDDSRLYFERIKVQPMVFPSMIARAESLITAIEPPTSSFPNECYYEARFMSEDDQAVYWGKALPAKKHCRNCKHSEAFFETNDASWKCNLQNSLMDRARQLEGCDHHEWLEFFQGCSQ